MTLHQVPKPAHDDADICAAFCGSYAELARQFGISESEVRQAIERNRHLLRGKRSDRVEYLQLQPHQKHFSRLEVLRNATAWAVLRLLFPRALARAKSAALSLIQEEQPTPSAPSGHRPVQHENVLIDFHPALPTADRPATSTALGYLTFSGKKPPPPRRTRP